MVNYLHNNTICYKRKGKGRTSGGGGIIGREEGERINLLPEGQLQSPPQELAIKTARRAAFLLVFYKGGGAEKKERMND